MNNEHQDLKTKLESALKRISELEAENSKLRNLGEHDLHVELLNTDEIESTENSQQKKGSIAHTDKASLTSDSINNQSNPEEKATSLQLVSRKRRRVCDQMGWKRK